MKTNIFLFILTVFIISLIITLNIFFMQSYQSEMAEQFNRQQLIIAKSIAKNIENEMQHIEDEALYFARLLANRGLDRENMEGFVNNAFPEIRENKDINIKILDMQGKLKYNSLSKPLDAKDLELFETAKNVKPGRLQYVDMLAKYRKIAVIIPIGNSQEIKGIIVVDIVINAISKKFLATMRAGIRGHAWMMDGNGTLLFHPTQPTMVGKNLYNADISCFECHKSFEVEKKILESGDIGFSSYIAPYGEDKLIAFSTVKIARMSWIICVSTPYSEVTFSIRKSMRLHSLLVISIFIATVVGAFAIILINRQRIKAEEKAVHLEKHNELEKKILQTKDYIENILESTESKIMVLDKQMEVRTVNSAQQKLSRSGKEDIIGKNFFDIFPIGREEDKNMIKDLFAECLKGSSQRLNNYPYIKDDGILYLNISINPLILHGEVSGIILSSSNITEEVNLRDELQNYAAKLEDIVRERTDDLLREKEKLDAIVGTLEAGIFIVDSEKNITWINRTLREWIGEEKAGAITFDSIYGSTEIQRAIVDNNIVQEILYQDLGKRKGIFQITTTPFIGPDNKVQALVMIQDITEMKKMEEQMMHSEKLSALARISAGVAHEIGNPLTSISSYIQILREMDFDDFTKESLETISKHINRITAIVRQMSGFSRTVASDLKRHDIKGILNATLELVRYDKRMKDITMNINVPYDLPKVLVDETQLIQVFMNIILNAADAMSNEGILDISSKKINHEIEISFSDSGPGIAVENLEKIFDPFFTTKEQGTGLGLAVSYNIIKSYHGDIVAESKPGGGAIFKVRVPYCEN